MLRADNHGWTKDAHDGWALSLNGRFSLAFDARIARHSRSTGTSSLGSYVGAHSRHKCQVLNFS